MMKHGSSGKTNTFVHDTAPFELKEGEVVIVCSEERNHGRWPLRVVTELIYGRDGIVRGTKPQSGTGYIERAVQHLYSLLVTGQLLSRTCPTQRKCPTDRNTVQWWQQGKDC